MPLALATAIRFAPYAIGALLLAFAVWSIRQGGVEAERAKWQAREALAVEAARAREAALQEQVVAAGAALSMSQAQIEQLAAAARVTTRNYYVTNSGADVACLLPERVRAVQASDAALEAASPAQ